MTFRKFLINNYWGKGYWKVPILNRWVSFYKGGPRNFLTLLVIGIVRILLDVFEVQSGDTIMIVLSVMFVTWVLFTGFPFPFKYWHRNPVRWEEIEYDMLKKWIYGQMFFASKGKYYLMTDEQLRYWAEIDKHYKKKFSSVS